MNSFANSLLKILTSLVFISMISCESNIAHINVKSINVTDCVEVSYLEED